MLGHDLKQAVYAQKQSNLSELKQFCREKWAGILPQRYERLIAGYYFIVLVSTKGGTTLKSLS